MGKRRGAAGLRPTPPKPEYRWSAVRFTGGVPEVVIRPVGSRSGENTGVLLVFDGVEDLRRLTSTLVGALSVLDPEYLLPWEQRKGEKK